MDIKYNSTNKLLLLLFVLISFSNNGFTQIGQSEKVNEQIHIGYNNNITKFHSLSYHINDHKKIYLLRYRNMEYQNIDTYCEIYFSATESELDYLYQNLKDGLNDTDGKTIDIGNHKMYIVKLGKSVQISDISPNSAKNYFWLTSKEIDRLFGKIK